MTAVSENMPTQKYLTLYTDKQHSMWIVVGRLTNYQNEHSLGF